MVTQNSFFELKVELIPIIKQDERTKQFVAHFKKFPRAIAYGETHEQAVEELKNIFAIMLREREDDIIGEIIKDYKRNSDNSLFEKLKDVKVYA